MEDLYYTLGDNGYDIYDHNDPLYHVSQYDEYNKPMDSTKTIEENAQAQVAELMTEPDPTANPEYIAGYDQALVDLLGGEQ